VWFIHQSLTALNSFGFAAAAGIPAGSHHPSLRIDIDPFKRPVVPVPGIDHVKSHLLRLSLLPYFQVKISLDVECPALIIGEPSKAWPSDRFFNRDVEIEDVFRVLEDIGKQTGAGGAGSEYRLPVLENYIGNSRC